MKTENMSDVRVTDAVFPNVGGNEDHIKFNTLIEVKIDNVNSIRRRISSENSIEVARFFYVSKYYRLKPYAHNFRTSDTSWYKEVYTIDDVMSKGHIVRLFATKNGNYFTQCVTESVATYQDCSLVDAQRLKECSENYDLSYEPLSDFSYFVNPPKVDEVCYLRDFRKMVFHDVFDRKLFEDIIPEH